MHWCIKRRSLAQRHSWTGGQEATACILHLAAAQGWRLRVKHSKIVDSVAQATHGGKKRRLGPESQRFLGFSTLAQMREGQESGVVLVAPAELLIRCPRICQVLSHISSCVPASVLSPKQRDGRRSPTATTMRQCALCTAAVRAHHPAVSRGCADVWSESSGIGQEWVAWPFTTSPLGLPWRNLIPLSTSILI